MPKPLAQTSSSRETTDVRECLRGTHPHLLLLPVYSQSACSSQWHPRQQTRCLANGVLIAHLASLPAGLQPVLPPGSTICRCFSLCMAALDTMASWLPVISGRWKWPCVSSPPSPLLDMFWNLKPETEDTPFSTCICHAKGEERELLVVAWNVFNILSKNNLKMLVDCILPY